MAFRTFMALCTHHPYPVPELSRHPKAKPCAQLLPRSPQPPASTELLSAFMALPLLDISSKRDLPTCCLLRPEQAHPRLWCESVPHSSFLTEECSIVWVGHIFVSIHPLLGVWVVGTFCYCEQSETEHLSTTFCHLFSVQVWAEPHF